MAEVLGIGLSHYPPLAVRDEDMAFILREHTLRDESIPAHLRQPSAWPDAMQREWGDDEGRASAADHRAALVPAFERCRAVLDAFEPDVVVMWGDDQYENFREDIIPPYAVLALPDIEIEPWAEGTKAARRPNVWDEGPDTRLTVRGRPDIARHLVAGLLERSFDVAYAYRRLHEQGLPHAFLNAIHYLDYHRTGFDHPVVTFPINCYGRRVISHKGSLTSLGDQAELDPPSPRPDRLMGLGAATAEVLAESPWRVALIASSSWSHAFLCEHTHHLWPDTAEDRRLYDALVAGDHDTWATTSLDQMEAAGQQELLNWFPLVGAMRHLGRDVTWSEFVPTHVFNSNKVFATYE